MKKNVVQYIVAAAVVLVAALVLSLVSGVFAEQDASELFIKLCNAFFVPGALMASFGVLVFASNNGAFDMLAFGFIKIADRFRTDVTKAKYRTFYDYRQAAKERRHSFGYLLIVGLAAVAVSLIFFALYKFAE